MKTFTLRSNLLFIAVLLLINLQAQESLTTSLQYVSPAPGALYATPEHSIAMRQGDVLDVNSLTPDLVSVMGSESGIHNGELKLSADSRTLIFTPHDPFNYDEEITVALNEGLLTASGMEVESMTYSFRTMVEDNTLIRDQFIQWMNGEYMKTAVEHSALPVQKGGGLKSTMALPDDYPTYEVTLKNNPGPGYWFVTPHNLFHPLNQPAYSVIMDHYGTPVFYKRNESHALDLKIQETGEISQFIASSAAGLGIAYGTFYTYDNSFNPVDTFQMGNGYEAEEHDFQLFNDGSYLLFTYDPQIIDMSEIVEDGDPEATVMGLVLQELDADDNVVFEWSSWDHIAITDATPDVDLTGVFIDYCHGNAMERDDDGNILVSFRNTDEIIKIDRNTGDLLWRLNGNREDLNDFTFVNDTIKFSHQHDIRKQDDGTITLFDNGNLHYVPYTRLLKYELDETNMTAELVWVYPPEPGEDHHFAFATGNAHWQPNGNVAVGWGLVFPIVPSQLIFGEVTPDYQTTFQVIGLDSNTTYRAHKYEWETDLFNLSKDTINWGQFTGYTPQPYIIQVTNNSDEAITISGTHNHTQEFYAATAFPLNIDPGATGNITINFFPATDGYFQDVMTIMCSLGEYEMMGKQVVLKGYTLDEAAPSVTFDPEDESEGIIRMPTLKMTFDEMIYKSNGNMITNNDLQDFIYLEQAGDQVPVKTWINWYDNQKTEIMIQPFDYLESNTEYTWGVHGDMIQDWAGNALADNVDATFITGEELGMDDILVNDFARVYPNPTSGLIQLEFVNRDEKALQIYNVAGVEVLNADHLSGLSYTFNLSDQPEGLYIVRVINKKTNASVELKLIKK
ncbi:MAG: aryl-sulfate sulfotransferase [Bacteroidetes bacterium]|nr:aryl-sulfate sulfotransferase [Bacteroidota bacterium]